MCDDVIFVWDRVSTRLLGGGWGWRCYETIAVVSICPLAALCIYIRVFNNSRAELILHNRLINVWAPSCYIIIKPNILSATPPMERMWSTVSIISSCPVQPLWTPETKLNLSAPLGCEGGFVFFSGLSDKHNLMISETI